MSLAAKQRPAAPNPPTFLATQTTEKNATNPTTPNYAAEAVDDVNMNEASGPVSLDVTLPSGQRMDVSVDYNTPMLDLLVCLAAKCKLNPTGLALILLSEDGGKILNYKPNQTVGFLGGQVVHIVSKDVVSGKSTSRESKHERQFEVTHRFTINFPRGQKMVVRVSPLTTLGELLITVCKDKGLDLDLSKYALQIPGKPGMPVDLGATVQQVGVHEMNLVTVAASQGSSHTVASLDLPRPAFADEKFPMAPVSGDHRKKKGILSFLAKKEKKNKSDTPHYIEPVSVTNLKTSVPYDQTAHLNPQKNVHDPENHLKRPQSVIAPSVASKNNSYSIQQYSQSLVVATHKKRRAPAPPVPTETQKLVSAPTPSLTENMYSNNQMEISSDHSFQSKNSSKENYQAEEIEHNKRPVLTRQMAKELEQISATSGIPHQQLSRIELLSHIHSRNSSDSSGYHELTFSGCESPEATHIDVTQSKTSIDTASIESSDNVNGNLAMQESPARVSPKVQLQEKSDVCQVSSPAASNTHTLLSKKLRKAPSPPAITTQIPPTTEMPPEDAALQALVNVVKDVLCNDAEVSREPLTESACSGLNKSGNENSDKELDQQCTPISDQVADVSETNSHDMNDVPRRVVWNDQPQSTELRLASQSEDEEKDSMVMDKETASAVSEYTAQVDISTHDSRPCLFSPPPPPPPAAIPPPPAVAAAPPPPPAAVVPVPLDFHSRDLPFEDKNSQTDETLLDSDTSFSDITSPAFSSAIYSPRTDNSSHFSMASVDLEESLNLDFQQAIQLGEEAFSSLGDLEASSGYKSEMALFVERMSKLAVEEAEKSNNEHLDDSVSSLSAPFSDSNSDTGSVIQHHQVDSSSEAGSVNRREDQKIPSMKFFEADLSLCQKQAPEKAIESFAVCEEIIASIATLPPPSEFDDKHDRFDEMCSDDKNLSTNNINNSITEIVGCEKQQDNVFNNDVFMQEAQPATETSPDSEQLYNTSILIDHRVPSTAMLTNPNLSQPEIVKQPTHTSLIMKEEIILTTEDLSNVSFLPPKSKNKKPIHIQPYVQTQPYVQASSSSLIMAKNRHSLTSSKAKETFKNLSEEKETKVRQRYQAVSDLPSTRSTTPANSVHINVTDDLSETSIDPLLTKSVPRLLMNSNSNQTLKSASNQIQVYYSNNKIVNQQISQQRSKTASTETSSKIDQERRTAPVVTKEMNTSQLHPNAAVAATSTITHAANTTSAAAVAATIDAANTTDVVTDRIHLLTSKSFNDKKVHQKNTPENSASATTAHLPLQSLSPLHLPLQDSGELISTSARQQGAVDRSKATFKPQQDPHEALMTAIRTFSREGMKSI